MITFGDFKTAIRAILFPGGEAPNQVAGHNAWFVDALIDLQQVVDCLQSDNTQIYPQCASFYQCGLTVLDAPRGAIKQLYVIDQIDPTTCLESTAVPSDYCTKIYYDQIDACHFKAFMGRIGRSCCLPVPTPLFFGLGPIANCGTGALRFPPTDAGLPPGLPALPLGFHYAQNSTDRVFGTLRWRSPRGVWAIERGKLWIAPWIQSTETVIVIWDGIKRAWADGDALDDDPLLQRAVMNYVRWQHADIYDEDEPETLRASVAYAGDRTALIHQCREETRVRECEPSHARSSVSSLTSLFYNTDQSASGSCEDGSNPISVTIPAGTVSSNISVADANQQALNEAQNQVQSRLASLCVPTAGTFQNTAQTATVACQGEATAPPPDGAPVTVVIPAGTVTSTISQADANQQALALAQAQAASQLRCIFWNAPQTVTLTCATNQAITASNTVAAHTFSSTVSQVDADSQANAAATTAATAALALVCAGSASFGNTQQRGTLSAPCDATGIHTVIIDWTIRAGYVFATTQQGANDLAIARGNAYASQLATQYCAEHHYGEFPVNVP